MFPLHGYGLTRNEGAFEVHEATRKRCLYARTAATSWFLPYALSLTDHHRKNTAIGSLNSMLLHAFPGSFSAWMWTATYVLPSKMLVSLYVSKDTVAKTEFLSFCKNLLHDFSSIISPPIFAVVCAFQKELKRGIGMCSGCLCLSVPHGAMLCVVVLCCVV